MVYCMAFRTKKSIHGEISKEIKDIGRAFSRESLLVVYGDIRGLRKEYGGKYSKIGMNDFNKLRIDTAKKQAKWLALRDPDIDKALDSYRKKDKKDAQAIHFNIELALSNDVVQREIDALNQKNPDAKGYTRLMIEWKTDNFLKKAGVTLVKIPFMILPVGCGGESAKEEEQESYPKVPTPKPTRVYAEAERSGLIGAKLGVPLPNTFPAFDPNVTAQKALVFSGKDLPLLRDKIVKGEKGDVLITQKLYVQTQTLFDEKQRKFSFYNFGSPMAVIEFSGRLAKGEGFSMLGRNVKVVEHSGGSLELENAQGKRSMIGMSSSDISALLGTNNVDAMYSAEGERTRIFIRDKNFNNYNYGFLSEDSFLLLNTFGFEMRGLDLKDADYSQIRIEPAQSAAPIKVNDGNGLEVELGLVTRIATGRTSFIIDKNKTNEFYAARTAQGEYKTIYKALGSNEYSIANSNSMIYENPKGEQSAIYFTNEMGENVLVFTESSGRPGTDRLVYRLPEYSSSSVGYINYEPRSVPVDEGGLGGQSQQTAPGGGVLPKIIQDFSYTYRGSMVFVTKDAVDIYSANKVGNITVSASQ